MNNSQAECQLAAKNREFYNRLWSGANFCPPERFNTWPLVSSLVEDADSRLEIGPGMHPRLPIEGTSFIDLSEEAVERLNAHGASASVGNAQSLQFSDDSFDLVCAFDIIEHIENQDQIFQELKRVLKTGGILVFSVPLHEDAWSAFDDIVGHYRRYSTESLSELLTRFRFQLEESACFGMKPKNRFITRLGLWWLQRFPELALHHYNKHFFPIALRRQPPLEMTSGFPDTSQSEGIVLKCRLL